MILETTQPDVYFQQSLTALRLSDYQSALESIDLAVKNSKGKSFYMFQKIKILFVGKMFSKCATYIEDNLITLYHHSSLYIFSQILSYYQVSSNKPLASIKKLLTSYNIPSVLADEFETFISHPKINLLEKIVQAKEIGNYIKCIDYCDLLLNKDSDNITAYLIKAKCHYLLSQYDLAISTYKKAIASQANIPSVYRELGSILVELDQYPEAIHYFQQAVDLDPSNTKLEKELAEGYFLWKKYDSALLHFKKVLAREPNCRETLLRLANTYDQINKPRQAKKYYAKVLRLKNNFKLEQNTSCLD